MRLACRFRRHAETVFPETVLQLQISVAGRVDDSEHLRKHFERVRYMGCAAFTPRFTAE
jgi:hypothetical protein